MKKTQKEKYEIFYNFEFKLDSTPEAALQQIDDKGYAKPFAMDKRKLYRIRCELLIEEALHRRMESHIR